MAFWGIFALKEKTVKTSPNNTFSILGRTTKLSALTDDQSASAVRGGDGDSEVQVPTLISSDTLAGWGPFSPAHPGAEQHLCASQGHPPHKTLGFCWL